MVYSQVTVIEVCNVCVNCAVLRDHSYYDRTIESSDIELYYVADTLSGSMGVESGWLD